MAMSKGEKKKASRVTCTHSVVTLQQGIFAARKPLVSLEQDKNTRLWTDSLRAVKLDTEYELPAGTTPKGAKHTFHTVYIHLTHQDIEQLRSNQDWYSRVCGKVRDSLDCCSRGYYLELKIDGTAIIDSSNAFRGASQESKAPNTYSSFPGPSRGLRHLKQEHFSSAVHYDIYCNLVVLYMAARCRHMDDKPVADKVRDYEAQIRTDLGCEARVEENDEEVIIHPGDVNAYPAMEAREYDGRLPELRPSITIRLKSLDARDEQVERFGGYWEQPGPIGADEPPQLGGILTGPVLCKVVASLRSSQQNTVAGMHRHGQRIIDPRTHELLPQPSKATLERLVAVALVLQGKYQQGARLDVTGCLESVHIPLKYGQELIDKLTERIEHEPHAVWTAFLKLRELGLDATKLPRVVVSFGQHKAMVDSQNISPVEHITNSIFKGCTMKYMTIDEQDQRMHRLLRNMKRPIKVRGRRIHKRGISTDFSKSDSTMTADDRRRYRMIVEAVRRVIRMNVTDEYTSYQDAALSAKKAELWWKFKFMDVSMDVKDCPLGSGERKTSNMTKVTVMECCSMVWDKDLDFEDLCFIITAWLSYDPALDDGETELTDVQRGQIAAGYLTPHGDGAFDISLGDGDDSFTTVLTYAELEDGEATDKVVTTMAECFKIAVPAFSDEPQDRCELLSRYHVLVSDTFPCDADKNLSYPKTSRLIQKLCVAISTHAEYDHTQKIAVINPNVAAEFATSYIQRAYQSKQCPVLRQLALGVARFWVEEAVKGGKTLSQYSDDELRKPNLVEFGLQERLSEVESIIAEQQMHWAEFVRTQDRKYANSTMNDADFREIVETLQYTDNEWRQMRIIKDHIECPTTFAHTFHCPAIIQNILSIDAWPSRGSPVLLSDYISYLDGKSISEATADEESANRNEPGLEHSATSLQSLPGTGIPEGGCALSHTSDSRIDIATAKRETNPTPLQIASLIPTVANEAPFALWNDVNVLKGEGLSHPARGCGHTGVREGSAKPGTCERSTGGQTKEATAPLGSGSAGLPTPMANDSVAKSEVGDVKTVCMATDRPCGTQFLEEDDVVTVTSSPGAGCFLEPTQGQHQGQLSKPADSTSSAEDGKLSASSLGAFQETEMNHTGANSVAAVGEAVVGSFDQDTVTSVGGSIGPALLELERAGSGVSSANTPPGLALTRMGDWNNLSLEQRTRLQRPSQAVTGKLEVAQLIQEVGDSNLGVIYDLLAEAGQPVPLDVLRQLWMARCEIGKAKKYLGTKHSPAKIWRQFHTLLTDRHIIARMTNNSRAYLYIPLSPGIEVWSSSSSSRGSSAD
jgi:hypothetical protein